jgi:hypothetical protein
VSATECILCHDPDPLDERGICAGCAKDYSCYRLKDLGGRLHVRDWRPISWAECDMCGGEIVGPVDDAERIYDGEPVVCTDCGEVAASVCDEDGARIGEPLGSLRPTALAGLRRLLGVRS